MSEVCVGGGTIVVTGDALARVRDLEGEASLLTLVATAMGEMRKGYSVAGFTRRPGPLRMLRVTTRRGFELVATEEALALTDAGLKSLSSVVRGDSLVLVKGFAHVDPSVPWLKESTEIRPEGPLSGGDGERRSQGEPEVRTWERAFVLALELATELRMPRRSGESPIVIGLGESELVDRTAYILRSWGVEHSVSRGTLGEDEFWIIDFEQPEFLGKWPETGSSEKSGVARTCLERIIPAPRTVVAAFLCGLFSSAGAVDESKSSVEGIGRTGLSLCLGPVPRPLLGQLQVLLLALGVGSAVVNGDSLEIPASELPAFLDRVGLASPRKVGSMLSAVISSEISRSFGPSVLEEFTDTVDLIEQSDEEDPVAIVPLREDVNVDTGYTCDESGFVLGGFVLGCRRQGGRFA